MVGCIISIATTTTTTRTVLEVPPPDADSEWSSHRCTYVASWGRSKLAIGYETTDDTQDVELHVVEWNNTDGSLTQERDNVGDVVPFFREEDDDIHCFYTAAVIPNRLAVVAANLGTDLGTILW